jgi:dephospho-CoA kinase
LKLALIGRSFSGKRTISKQIQELYNGKIKIFNMNDMIKECVEYSNPKPVAELPNPADKNKKPPPKGK